MLDINLGNKTLIVGVLIALILSYGMVNFDSGVSTPQGIQGLDRQAAYFDSHRSDSTDRVEATEALAQEPSADLFDGSSLSAIHQHASEEVVDENENRHERRERIRRHS